MLKDIFDGPVAIGVAFLLITLGIGGCSYLEKCGQAKLEKAKHPAITETNP